MVIWLILFGTGLSLVLILVVDRDPLQRTVSTESIKQGEKLFKTNCQSCHGVAGVGEDPKRPMGADKLTGGYFAPALNGSGHTWHHPDKMLFNNIKNGSFAEDSQMIGVKDKLNDEEIVSIMHYFQSLWPKRIMDRRKQNSN
ncbi:MAG: cytochrome c [Proteobacteria bacterium]|nr:cytochrome c [Pseudomonadota bacterium]